MSARDPDPNGAAAEPGPPRLSAVPVGDPILSPRAIELPLHRPGPVRERADAARNRTRILEAARQLFSERGVEAVSMDCVARTAGVGKGTLYRRFGDRASLARTLLEEHEIPFQEAIIRGEPPLGPGAPPEQRLRAFGPALMDVLERNSALVLASESGEPFIRFAHPVYQLYRTHVGLLLEQADPSVERSLAAEMLLAPLHAELFLYLRTKRGIELDELKRAWQQVVDRLLS